MGCFILQEVRAETWQEKNEHLMGLIRALCERKQMKHTHTNNGGSRSEVGEATRTKVVNVQLTFLLSLHKLCKLGLGFFD